MNKQHTQIYNEEKDSNKIILELIDDLLKIGVFVEKKPENKKNRNCKSCCIQ